MSRFLSSCAAKNHVSSRAVFQTLISIFPTGSKKNSDVANWFFEKEIPKPRLENFSKPVLVCEACIQRAEIALKQTTVHKRDTACNVPGGVNWTPAVAMEVDETLSVDLGKPNDTMI